MMKHLLHSLTALAIVLPAAFAQDPKPAPEAKPADRVAPAAGLASSQGIEKQVIAAEKPSYPLTTCVVSGEKLGPDALDRVFDGHLVRLCCKDCIAAVEKDPALFRKKIEAAVVKEQKPSYPLMTCAVTGEELAFDSIDYVHGTRLVRLKNQDTVASFTKNPAEVMTKINRALIDAQLKQYSASTCPITGDQLDRKAVNHLYGTKLVRLCCAGCIRKFEGAPEKYLAELAKPK